MSKTLGTSPRSQPLVPYRYLGIPRMCQRCVAFRSRNAALSLFTMIRILPHDLDWVFIPLGRVRNDFFFITGSTLVNYVYFMLPKPWSPDAFPVFGDDQGNFSI